MGLLNLFQSKKQRRAAYREQKLPEPVLDWLNNLPVYRMVPDSHKADLRGHMQVVLNEKTFEGCGGLEVTDEMRYLISLHAGILLLGGISDYYPTLRSILIYPDTYHAPFTKHQDDFVVQEGVESRIGESWSRGNVVLAWQSVWEGASSRDGYNVVYHEFAHQLDHEYGLSEQVEACAFNREPDSTVFTDWYREYRHYQRKLQRRQRPLFLDPYAGTNPAEFFAVATESFFEKPYQLRRTYPTLFRLLTDFYQLDPARWNEN